MLKIKHYFKLYYIFYFILLYYNSSTDKEVSYPKYELGRNHFLDNFVLISAVTENQSHLTVFYRDKEKYSN